MPINSHFVNITANIRAENGDLTSLIRVGLYAIYEREKNCVIFNLLPAIYMYVQAFEIK